MTIIQKIKQFLFPVTSSPTSQESHCPNCWGRQEYNGRVLKVVRNEKIDLNNIDQKKGWVDAYFIRYFEGLKLRTSQPELVCATCNVSYRPEEY